MNKKFPLFIDLTNKNVVVIGAGNIALRRIKILIDFNANIKVIAPIIKDKQYINYKNVNFIEREFQYDDIKGAFIVIAATNIREVNHLIYSLCVKNNIYVSVADSREESTFFFPAICTNEKLSIGIVSDGSEHSTVKKIAQKIRELINKSKL